MGEGLKAKSLNCFLNSIYEIFIGHKSLKSSSKQNNDKKDKKNNQNLQVDGTSLLTLFIIFVS